MSASDEAVWRRAITVRFDFNFKTYAGFNQKVKDQLRSPEARPGILAWLVRGALAWQKDGLMIPTIVQVETAAHRLEVSEVQTFLDESCVIDAGLDEHASITGQELYRSFATWARDRGAAKMTMSAFNAELTRLGYEPMEIWSKRNKSTRWRGVRLRGTQE